MNARAHNHEPAAQPMRARAEHISIEASPDIAAPVRHPHRRTLSKFILSSRLRAASTELSLLQDHYISVRQTRGKEAPRKYVLDLRFVNARPERVRNVAWVFLGAAIVALLATIGALLWARSEATNFWMHPGFFGAVDPGAFEDRHPARLDRVRGPGRDNRPGEVAGPVGVRDVPGRVFFLGLDLVDAFRRFQPFGADGDGSLSQDLFFSFTTMLTIGFGNLVPAGNPGQSMAVAEGLTGQLFLVVAVAKVVSAWRPKPRTGHGGGATNG